MKMNLKTIIPAVLMVFALGQRMAQGQTNSAEMNGTLKTTCNCIGNKTPLLIKSVHESNGQTDVITYKPSSGLVKFTENAKEIIFNGEHIGYKGNAQKYNINDEEAEIPQEIKDIAVAMKESAVAACTGDKSFQDGFQNASTTSQIKSSFGKILKN